MANFEPCLRKTLELEGGYTLHNVKGDSGGQTYAGIARNKHPTWEGWTKVDLEQFDEQLKDWVKDFYRREFWDKIQGDVIGSLLVAFNIFDFAVNSGLTTSVRRVQHIVGARRDGILGPATFRALNEFAINESLFVSKFVLERCFYYRDICSRKPDQLKFLVGWLNRAEQGLKI